MEAALKRYIFNARNDPIDLILGVFVHQKYLPRRNKKRDKLKLTVKLQSLQDCIKASLFFDAEHATTVLYSPLG